MPKNWGRLVSATLSESVKLASVSERCGFVYCLMLPHHDGEGRIPVDEVSLVDLCGRCAIVHGWTLEKMPAIREEIGRAGLWRVYASARGGLAAEVVDWWKHQRMDKIRRGSDLMAEGELPHDHPLSVRLTVPTSPVIGANVGSLNARISVGSKDKRIKEKGTQERPRARSEEDAKIPEKAAHSPARKAEIGYVIGDWREAWGEESWGPSNVDDSAVDKNLEKLVGIQDRRGHFSRAADKIRASGRTPMHLLADAIQLFVNGATKLDMGERLEAPPEGTWREDFERETEARKKRTAKREG